MGEMGAGNVFGNHGQVAAVGARGAFDVEAVDQSRGRDGIGRRNFFGRARDGDGFVGSGQAQGNMQNRPAARVDGYGLGGSGQSPGWRR